MASRNKFSFIDDVFVKPDTCRLIQFVRINIICAIE
jgi:hypothetical protein